MENRDCIPLIGCETAVECRTVLLLRPCSGKNVRFKSQVRISLLERALVDQLKNGFGHIWSESVAVMWQLSE